MTTSAEQPGTPYSYRAAVDLSDSQYKGVKLASTGYITSFASSLDEPEGILRNAPVTGGAASVLRISDGGISKCYLGATMTAGDRVGFAADGTLTPLATGMYPAGNLVKGGLVDEIGSVSLSSKTVQA